MKQELKNLFKGQEEGKDLILYLENGQVFNSKFDDSVDFSNEWNSLFGRFELRNDYCLGIIEVTREGEIEKHYFGTITKLTDSKVTHYEFV